MDFKNFQLGQQVWTLRDGKAVSFKIKRIATTESIETEWCYRTYYSTPYYQCDEIAASDKDVFSSKEELKKSVFGEDE